MDIPVHLAGRTLIFDIDGTLVPAGGTQVSSTMTALVEWLKKHNEVYVFSNKRLPERNRAIADSLKVPLLASRYRKPSLRVLDGVSREKPLVVVGDKVLTDGLLAWRAGAEFIKVERLTHKDESASDQLLNALDDIAGYAWNLLVLLRPLHWVKNVLIFAPVFFSGEAIFSGALGAATAAFFAFSFLASAGYIANDLSDIRADRRHPKKRHRPLASGRVPVHTAMLVFVGLVAIALATLAMYAPSAVLIGIAYLLMSLVYSLWFKSVPIVEMILFTWFYYARVAIGGIAAGVVLTAWLTLAVVFLALFLVIAKRYAQLVSGTGRTGLAYPEQFLRGMLFSSATLVLVFYALYTVLGAGKGVAAYSVVPVLGGVMRYLQLALADKGVEYPEKALFKDPGLLICGVLWGALMLMLFYGPAFTL